MGLMRPTAVDPENKDAPPTCKAGCAYKQKFSSFSLQRNAIRTETTHMIAVNRCGWNLKPGVIGGSPLDYAPCVFPDA